MPQQIKIVFVDENVQCLRSIVERFDRELGDKLEKIMITSREYMQTFFSQPQSIDALVIDEKLWFPGLTRQGIGSMVVLSEDDDHLSPLPDGAIARVCKYKNMTEVYNEIASSCQLTAVEESGGASLILSYSPIGGVGKTSASLALCYALVRKNCRPLFVSIESAQSFALFMSQEVCAPGETERLLRSPAEFVKNIGSITAKIPFSYILPFSSSPSALSLKPEDYIAPLLELRQAEVFTHIIVDAPSDFTESTAKLIAAVDRVLMFVAQDELSVAKVERLLPSMEMDKGRLTFVCNRFEDDKKDNSIRLSTAGCHVRNRIELINPQAVNETIQSLAATKGIQALADSVR